jgi:hypothetical protein
MKDGSGALIFSAFSRANSLVNPLSRNEIHKETPRIGHIIIIFLAPAREVVIGNKRSAFYITPDARYISWRQSGKKNDYKNRIVHLDEAK